MRRKDTTHDRRCTYACAPQVPREIAMHIASAGCRHFPCAARCRAMPHKAKKYRKPAHRKCRECFRRTVHDCPNERAAYFADILQHFCEMSAKYGERLGAITQGEDLTNGTLRCAGAFCKFAAGAQCAGVFASLRRERSAQSFSCVCGGSAVRRRFRVFAARAQRAVVFVCLRRECSAHALFASLRRERSAQVFSHLRAYLPPFVNGVPGNTGSLK